MKTCLLKNVDKCRHSLLHPHIDCYFRETANPKALSAAAQAVPKDERPTPLWGALCHSSQPTTAPSSPRDTLGYSEQACPYVLVYL